MAAAPITLPNFDFDGARKAGYSDDEIAQHLSKTRNFDYAGAIKAGYSPADVITHLTTPPTSLPKPPDTQRSNVKPTHYSDVIAPFNSAGPHYPGEEDVNRYGPAEALHRGVTVAGAAAAPLGVPTSLAEIPSAIGGLAGGSLYGGLSSGIASQLGASPGVSHLIGDAGALTGGTLGSKAMQYMGDLASQFPGLSQLGQRIVLNTAGVASPRLSHGIQLMRDINTAMSQPESPELWPEAQKGPPVGAPIWEGGNKGNIGGVFTNRRPTWDQIPESLVPIGSSLPSGREPNIGIPPDVPIIPPPSRESLPSQYGVQGTQYTPPPLMSPKLPAGQKTPAGRTFGGMFNQKQTPAPRSPLPPLWEGITQPTTPEPPAPFESIQQPYPSGKEIGGIQNQQPIAPITEAQPFKPVTVTPKAESKPTINPAATFDQNWSQARNRLQARIQKLNKLGGDGRAILSSYLKDNKISDVLSTTLEDLSEVQRRVDSQIKDLGKTK